jgi:hypothetical protein
MVLMLNIDCMYDTPWVKLASNDRFCYWQEKSFVSGVGTVPDVTMTFLSNMSDTTYVPLRVAASWCRKIVGLESPGMTCLSQ